MNGWIGFVNRVVVWRVDTVRLDNRQRGQVTKEERGQQAGLGTTDDKSDGINLLFKCFTNDACVH